MTVKENRLLRVTEGGLKMAREKSFIFEISTKAGFNISVGLIHSGNIRSAERKIIGQIPCLLGKHFLEMSNSGSIYVAYRGYRDADADLDTERFCLIGPSASWCLLDEEKEQIRPLLKGKPRNFYVHKSDVV